MEIDQRCSSSVHNNQDDQLKSAKAEMGDVREENEKLKLTLSKIMKDYRSLQMHFNKIVQQDAHKVHEEERELVSLSLGRFPSDELKKKDIQIGNHDHQGLELGLDCNFNQSSAALMRKSNNIASPGSSLNESNEETITEAWPPASKSVKTSRSVEDEISQQSPLKKARVSVRAICNTATMNDGCQWRKYGQKIAKGNPCPRAYYRCTVSSSCPVRKHVQRCANDMSVLITTYEGTHNHPLPVSATAMASTTSAAASMLKSASSTSQTSVGTITTSANLHGLNFTHPPPPQLSHPFYFPNTTFSTTQSHPTVTLDLTAPTTTPHFKRTSLSSSSSLYSSQKYLPMCLDFSSSSTNNRNNIGSSYFSTQQIQQQSYQPYTIEAATKEIASNPKFRSALAAAITSFVGKAREKNNGAGENCAFPLNLGHSSSSGIGCASSYLNRLPAASNSQEGNLTLFPSLLQLSASKKPSVSPIDEGDNIK